MLPERKHDLSAFHDLTSNKFFIERDEDLVFEARTLLGLLDFEFFRVAWRNVHGDEPDDRRLEPGFMAFLLKQQAPSYVRQFARLVLRRAATGSLDPVDFGVKVEPEAEPKGAPLSAYMNHEFASTSLWVIMGLLLIVAF